MLSGREIPAALQHGDSSVDAAAQHVAHRVSPDLGHEVVLGL